MLSLSFFRHKISLFFPLSFFTLWPALVSGADPVTFATQVVVPPSGNDGVSSSEGADFDQDGRIEFISAATQSTSDAHFRLYDYVDGSFAAINLRPDSEIQNRLDRFGGDLTPADINNDGWVDIVVPESRNGNGGGSVSWFENPDGDLDGVWTEHVIATWSGAGDEEVIAHMSEIDVGDIDGDGRLDVVTRDVSHGVFIMLQKTDGTGWRPRRFIATNPREGLDLFNPDGDNDLDIILNGVWLETPSDPLSGTYQVHSFGAEWYPDGNSSDEIRDYAVQIAVADFNGDFREDIAISNSEELNNANSTDDKPKGIQVFLAPVDPKTESWTRVVVETEHFSWHSLEVADFNGDGALDFVSAITTIGRDNAPAELVYFLNNGTGTEFTKVDLLDASVPFVYNATLGDADGDGDADLFAPEGFSDGPIRYFENTSPVISVPDLIAPEMPQGLEASMVSSSRVLLSWSAASDNVGVSGYRVFQDGSFLAEVNDLSYLVLNLTPDTLYQFSVTAFDLAGNESEESDLVIVRTEFASPQVEGLMAYWPMDEGEPSVSTIDQIEGRLGTFSGVGVSWESDGRFSRALHFDHETARVEVPSFDVTGDQLTLAAWVRLDGVAGSASEARFLSKATGPNEQDHIWMLGNDGSAGSALRFRLKTGNGGTETLVSPAGQLSLNEWVHIAASYDGAAMRLFRNGVEVAAVPKSGPIAVSNAGVGLGNQPQGAGERALDGSLDEVRIYDTALTADQIQMLMLVPQPEPEFAQWIASFLNAGELADQELSDPEGDANEDGVANLIDFALGQSPLASDRSSYPEVELRLNEFVYTYRRLLGGISIPGGRYRYGNLVYTVEVSEFLDAGSWQSGAGVIQLVGAPEDQLDGTEKASVRVLGEMAESETIFFRLRLNLE